MAIKDDILKASIAIALKNKHGHMTTANVQAWLIVNRCTYTIHQTSTAMSIMNIWRKGMPRKFREGFLIRELREDLWAMAPPITEINSLRYQLKQANKHVDALKIKYNQAVVRSNKHMSELNRVRHAWREFNNLMQDRR